MAVIFPSQEWLDTFIDYLNSDEAYAKRAAQWEGDILFDIAPEGGLTDRCKIYIDLWHGKCKGGRMVGGEEDVDAAFVLAAPYGNIQRILIGDLDPMQAMLTRKLTVKGSMPYMLRNVPTVLEFVRCAKDITEGFLEA
jgi:putative sterol carrier protein